MDSASNLGTHIFTSLPLFQGVDAKILDGFLAAGHYAQYDKGAIFLAQGQPITRFYVILEGWVGASKVNVEGQEAILQIFRSSDFLPEPDEIATMESSLINLQALTPVKLLVLPTAVVQNAMNISATFANNMLAASVRRGQDLRDHIEQLTLHSAEQRVGRFLLQMRFINISSTGEDIALPFDKALIASYLGIKPETLSRTLQLFKENGFVIERNHLIVPDRQALCDYCDQVTMRSCRFAHTDDCLHSTHGEMVT